MNLQEININFHNSKTSACAAYFVPGTLEIYFDDFTMSKQCDQPLAMQICKALGIAWSDVVDVYKILEEMELSES